MLPLSHTRKIVLRSLVVAILLLSGAALSHAATLPDPAVDPAATAGAKEEIAVFAGGCFWGVEAVYRHVKGVSRVLSGYTGGTTTSPTYQDVSMGDSGHAESVWVVFDPAQVSYGQLLKVFFSVAHDPTELNRQGPDEGTQYRSAIFFVTPQQRSTAEAYVSQLQAAKAFPQPIVTQIAPLATFYQAEAYHQNYLALHPDEPYIVINDQPKLDRLRKEFPALYH
jgi:peptide-methionine (S)-S-oxide reductase